MSRRFSRTSPTPPLWRAARLLRKPGSDSRRRSSRRSSCGCSTSSARSRCRSTPSFPGRVEVRLAGREPELVYVEDEEAEPAAAPDDALTARITLRISDSLKAQVELAAARESLSVNSWIVRALARGLETRSVRAGRRLTGFAES